MPYCPAVSRLLAAIVALAGLLAMPAAAESGPLPGTAQARAEIEAAVAAANAAIHHGPEKIPLAGQAQLDLPAGYDFVPGQQAIRFLKALGNTPGDDVLGLISPADDNASWFMVVRYLASGYVRDEDAKDWNADDLLKNIRAGTEESNQARRERGFPEMEVLGWIEKPQYEAATHRLVWSIASRRKGGSDAEGGVNYSTLALGREGYVSMNMVAARQDIEALKPTARALLATLNFDEGRRYADYNASTDKTAEYGLAALVAGVAAKKLGFFAVAAAFFAKFAKVIGLAVVAGGAALAKLARRKKETGGEQA